MTLAHTSFSLCKDLNNEMTDKKFVLILLQLDKKEIQEIFPEEILSKNNYKSQKMTFVATQSSPINVSIGCGVSTRRFYKCSSDSRISLTCPRDFMSPTHTFHQHTLA